jgi:hypothetical protein
MNAMTFPPVLVHWLGTDRVADLAERVAGRSRMAIWQRVMHRLPTLGPTEARGYVRARGIGVVIEETDRLIDQEGARLAPYREQIVEGALKLLIQTMSSQMQQQRRTGGGLRRAA